MNSANWMIQAIEQRRQTMLKVMHFIVDRQRDFFEKGVQYLKPLTLREVAEVINMHESTVSRVTNEKYVQTPRGVLPLKFFFSIRPLDRRRRGCLRSRHQGTDREARGGRGSQAPAHRSGDREHPQGERRPDRPPHGRQVPRSARRSLGPDAQASMTLVAAASPQAAIDVSVLVPAKDEAENLPLFMEQAAAAFATSPASYEVVVIDDGSRRRHAPRARRAPAAVSVSARRQPSHASAASPTPCAPDTSTPADACLCSIRRTCNTGPRISRDWSRRSSPENRTWSPATSRACTRRRSSRASTTR